MKKIWLAKVPQRVKNLVWRAVSNGLPTMSTLAKRGLKVDPRCPQCGEAMETTAHMVAQCSDSKLLWVHSPVRTELFEPTGSSFAEWCIEMSKKCKLSRMWEIVMMLIWQAWNMRNMWTFEKKRMDPLRACNKSMSLLGEFEAALERDQTPVVAHETGTEVWQPPRVSLYKLNTDAAVREDRIGLGMVVRDCVGDVMMAAGMSITTDSSALRAEAEAVRFGMRYTFDAGLRHLEVETDCSPLAQLLKKQKKERSITQAIVDDILALASNFELCVFNFAKRSCNKVAHSIAKSSLPLDEALVWMEDHPTDVLPLVVADKAFLYE